jgi:2,4-dienoyl-CoA reductase-like NADH-dependent reductase (Old Yellow Enzyme family)
MAERSRLMSPLDLRSRELRNRVVFGAHTANMGENGLPGPRYGAYLLERAIGGAAMIVAEPMPVHRTAVLTRGNFRHCDDAVIPAFRRIVEPVKDAGAVILQQLYHVGQHGDSDLSFAPHWGPSGMPSYHDSDGSHAMTAAEIEEVIDGFVAAARRCREAGFDGVEVWAAYHSLLDQFWNPWSNRRDDTWGGSLENRTRLSRTIIERIRRACGEDFIIGLAVSHSCGYSVLPSAEALAEIVALHDASGHVDYVTCGSGGYLDFDRLMPTFLHEERPVTAMTALLKQAVRNARVTAESHIRTPENAEAVLREGEADLVSIVRGQIADPHWARKVAQAREEDVRGCISCNQMCWGRRSRDYWISCLVNPSAGREFEWGGDRFSPADVAKRVMVVGAGPAGLEAARVAAARGHQVELVEAAGEVGGQFLLAGLQPRRAQILDLLAWYERQLEGLRVQVRRNCFAEADEIRAAAPDVVVLATGSLPDEAGRQRWLPEHDELPGLKHGGIWSPEEVMRREARLGERVLVYDEGGNWRGLGTAWYLAEQGKQVVIVTPEPFIGREIARTAADLNLRQRLARLGTRWLTEHVIAEWSGNGATVRCLLTGVEQQVSSDGLVLSTTNIAFDPLSAELDGIDVRLIGDAQAPRLAPYAFYEGRKVGLEI